MKLWCFTLAHFGSADCDAAIKAAAEKYTPLFDLTVLCPCDSWQTSEQYGAIVQGFCADNAALKNALCEEFVRSYQAQLAIRALCAKSGMPDAIVFPACDAYGYYTVLYSYLDSAFYAKCPIYLAPFETENEQAPPYLLPHWWINQQNDFCSRFARGIVNESAADFAKAVALNAQTPFAPSAFPFTTQRPQTPAPQLENEQKGLLSIIIPYYNLGRTLPETLASAFACEYPCFEVILINDGSTDAESLRVLKEESAKYPNLRVVTQENKGLSAVRNRAFIEAKGEYLTYLDADDKIAPSYYSRCIALLEQYPNAGYCGSWLQCFGDNADIVPYFSGSLPAVLLYNSQSSFCVSRRAVYAAFGQNDTTLKKGLEDHDAWLSLAEHGWFGIMIPEAISLYRISQGSMSAAFSRDVTHQKHMHLFEALHARHQGLYREYENEIYNLLQSNGPSYLWNGLATVTGTPHLLLQLQAAQTEFTLARAHSENLEASRAVRLAKRLRQFFK